MLWHLVLNAYAANQIENDCNFHTRIKNMYFNVKSAYNVVRQHITRLKELPSNKRFIWFNCNRFKGISIKNTIENQLHFIYARETQCFWWIFYIYNFIHVFKTVKLGSKRKLQFPALVYVLLFLIDLVFLKFCTVYTYMLHS